MGRQAKMTPVVYNFNLHTIWIILMWGEMKIGANPGNLELGLGLCSGFLNKSLISPEAAPADM